MRLVGVKSGKRAPDGSTLLAIIVDFGFGAEEVPFSYNPKDPYGVAPKVKAWLQAHPEFRLS